MTYSEIFSRYSVSLRSADLSPLALDAAKRHLLDVIGVGLVGSSQDVAHRALDGISRIPGSQGECQVWGRDQTLASPYAALANGVAAHVLDYDDTHTDSITHGSAVLGPTVLALGQSLSSCGADMLAAFVLGWEITARVGLASRGSFHKRGFHTTSIAGIFGATIAAAKLLGLSEAETSHALGLAGSQVSGVSEYLSNGSSSKSFHPGWAAHAGITAAYLAKAGMTGPMTVFEGRYGLFKTYGVADDCDLESLTSELGTRWEVTRISLKPYPCCHFAHAFIDCAKALRRNGITADRIERIECVVPEIELPLICEPFASKLRPDTPYAAKFSLPYLVAAALVNGNVNHDTFTPAAIQREDLLQVAQRVGYRVARPGEMPFPTYFPGWLSASLKDGGRAVERLDINTGNPDNPMSRLDLEAKFRANGQAVLAGNTIDTVLDKFWNFEKMRSGELFSLLGATAFRHDARPRRAEGSRQKS